MANNVSIKKKLDMFLNEKFQAAKLEDALGDRFGRYSKYITEVSSIFSLGFQKYLSPHCMHAKSLQSCPTL